MNDILNDDQKEASAKIKAFLTRKDTIGEVFTLTGGPGTGKTFMLKDVLSHYKGKFQAATVSHAAKNILQQSLGEDVPCVTLAKLLGLSQNITEDGQVQFVRAKSKQKLSQIGDAKVLIIDEVSQIPDDIYELICHEIKNYDVRLIAVGDPYQLPPVEQETDSKFFDKIDAKLTIPMRYQGPIGELAAIYKNQIDHINNESGFDKWALNTYTHRRDKVENDTGYLFTNRLDEIIEKAAYDIRTHPDDVSYARVLAFKHESVAEINNRIREKLYGTNLCQFENKELVICNGGYGILSGSSFGGEIKRTPVLYNGQILRVKSYKPVIGPEEVPCVLMSFENYPNLQGYPIYVVQNDPDSQAFYNKKKDRLEMLAKKATEGMPKREAWRRYYAFVESFAYFGFSSSLVLYRAQGQTVTNVYVCEGETMNVKPLTWKQKFQALYVAMTRAKEKVYIYNKEF